MKIVIYVDYKSKDFNNDFKLSNALISEGHNVFLAVNDRQFEDLKKNCDKAVLGYSYNNNYISDVVSIKKNQDIAKNIEFITNN